MKKVMIVDDEFLVRLGIKSLLHWEDYGYEIVGEAESGQEALEKIEKIHPQIILTDLRMSPGDGFLLIEQCRQKYPEMKFVVLSNYNDFENVRRAMKMGASDYVFKLTLKAQELLQVLDEVSGSGSESGKAVSEEGPARETERAEREMPPGQNREMIKAGILKNLMEARDGYYEVNLKTLSEYPFCVDFEKDYRIMTITLDDLSIARCSGNFLESDLLKFAIENMIGEIFEDHGEKEIFRYGECDFILVLSSGSEAENFREKTEAEFARLHQYVQKYCGLHISGAVCSQSRGLFSLKEGILENAGRLRMRFWNRQEGILWPEEDAKPLRGTKRSEAEVRKIMALADENAGFPGRLMPAESGSVSAELDRAARLEVKIQAGGIREGLACWEELMEEVRRSCAGDVQKFRESLLGICRVLSWYLKKGGIDVRHIQDGNGVNLETAIREYDFYEEIEESFQGLRQQYLAFAGEGGSSQESRRRPCRKEVLEVKSFVQAHYGEKLSVAQIAEMVNMSESRFAHVFKKETGISFWEYVNQVRMDQAEKLLKETDMRIGDIAERIGMDNPNYFSSQFKKRKGKSPLAYRNMAEPGETAPF